MIKHYLKVAFRNLIKYKTQSLVSIIGLAVGFTCFALSVLWIRYEMTYDNFHEGADRIYLVRAHYANEPGTSKFTPFIWQAVAFVFMETDLPIIHLVF